tara:strand:- start:1130 stop:1405 length:276 start_codon:yes stop_codon:yes gene_type:complete
MVEKDNPSKANQMTTFDVLDDRLLIAIITESGQVVWVTCKDPSIKQQIQFQKIIAVTHNPSFVISFILFIEITILKLLSRFGKPNKGDNSG